MEPSDKEIPGRVERQFPEWTYKWAHRLPEITEKVVRLAREARSFGKGPPKYGDWRDVVSFNTYWEDLLNVE